QQAETRKKALESAGNFVISKQLGENESIFGTVTSQEVAELIFNTTGQEIDRRGITLPEIRKIGSYKAEIKLHSDVTADIEIQVVPL
ncbi:MAG TPA: 50S ribosomal protein L9, partial [Kamptonema sp.]|nr:50S ribosomal protein L9 [Kamptonema sp.]